MTIAKQRGLIYSYLASTRGWSRYDFMLHRLTWWRGSMSGKGIVDDNARSRRACVRRLVRPTSTIS